MAQPLAGGDVPSSDAVADSLFSLIKVRFEQPGRDTVCNYMLQLVRNQCRGSNYNCSIFLYDRLIQKLSKIFNLSGSICLLEEKVKIFKTTGQVEHEGNAYLSLSSVHAAFGNKRSAILYIDRALLIFKKLGNKNRVLTIKMKKLEASADLQSPSSLLDSMEALLQDAIARQDRSGEEYIRMRSINYLLNAGRYDDVEAYLKVLSRRKASNPIQQSEYPFLINTNLGFADLALARGQLDTAIFYYKKTLALAEVEPGPWIQINVLNILGNIEQEKGNMAAAKSYLGRARGLGEKIEVHDLLTTTFEILVRIAEAENNFEDAFKYTKLKNHHQQKFNERGADFSIQAYMLQLENKRLETDRQKDQIALQLKSDQLRNSVIAIVFVSLLVALILFGLYMQRQGKKKIAEQYTLIKRQAEQLKNLDASKSRFFANVSHELRTPISLIQGPIGTVLKRSQLNDEDQQLLKMARQGGQNLQLLVNEILDLGKMESGKMGLVKNSVRLADFFTHYFTQFESLGYQKKVSYDFEVLVPDNMAVFLDKEKCRQLVFNLLSNAFKFTPSGGKVKAILKTEKKQLHLEVSDTGKGIHPTDLPHVFDRYFQTNRPDATASGGTGIGLTLCYEYVKLFGGNISVESTLGKGTVFKAVFPVDLAEDLSDELASASMDLKEKHDELALPITASVSTANGSKKPTVLVVEDNAELQQYIQLVLKEHFQVTLAENGQAALEKIKANGHPDLIISDLMMPVMDGYQFLEKLKGDPSTQQLPVIMLTARAEKDDRLKALRIGVDDYLTKPFDEEELIVRIGNLLTNQSFRQEAVLEEQAEKGESMAKGVSEMDKKWLDSFENYLTLNLSNNNLTILQLADEFAMSMSTLLRQLKRLTGLTPQKYLVEMRLEKARQLLAEGRFGSVSRVAREVGYNDVRNFSKSFKSRFGKKPSELVGV